MEVLAKGQLVRKRSLVQCSAVLYIEVQCNVVLCGV